MRKKVLFFYALFCVLTSSYGQIRILGQVAAEELQQKKHPNDTSAVAAIQFKKGLTTFVIGTDSKWYMHTEVQQRIKIYKKEGYSYANTKVPIYNYNGSGEKVTFENAFTYNWVNGKIEKTKLTKEGEFKEKVNENWDVKKIVMPAVKEGSIVEYQYTIVSPFITDLRDWDFQYFIPAGFVSYKVNIPDRLVYNQILTGSTNINKESVVESSLNGDYAETKLTYTVKDVPAIKEEKYVDNIKNYISGLKFELIAVNYVTGSHTYAKDWNDVVKNIYNESDFGRQLNLKSYFEEELNPVLRGVTDKDEKLKKIFNFVKQKMTWNETNGYLCNEGVKTAFKNKVGNVAEINLMLIAMLRYAGLEANPVLISTRNNGIAPFPSRTAFNYVIAAVKKDGKNLFLDATDKNTEPDVLPFRAINWIGRLIRADETSEQVELVPTFKSRENSIVMADLNKEGVFTGKVRKQYLGYNAFEFKSDYAGLSKEKTIETIEKEYNGIELGDYSVVYPDDTTKPVTEDYSFSHPNMVERIGDRLYFSPLLFLAMSENPFKLEKRQYPIDFIYPFQQKNVISINVPEGYEVESLPEATTLAMEEQIGTFKYNIVKNDRQLQLMVLFDINHPNIPESYYDNLKGFFNKMIKKHTEKIVLKKS
ncbi:DUF3857 domain-containing protein [Flavobacterium cerinum]|uniref:DUF3857 domain-containing protein n=1 Tax=Flavobacterium cerinum TaxID=2502784 RepID=A0ABY5IZA4_9FLAO|nr:DUF3857 domain-containing protein [Flavobacterium cerinum]UUC46832.1 DUF3857 domain-containing protein [Flavobacterium cerinum]